MNDEEQPADTAVHEDELHLWAEWRSKPKIVVDIPVVFKHNCHDELEIAFTTRDGQAGYLLFAEHQWRMLNSFLEHNRGG